MAPPVLSLLKHLIKVQGVAIKWQFIGDGLGPTPSDMPTLPSRPVSVSFSEPTSPSYWARSSLSAFSVLVSRRSDRSTPNHFVCFLKRQNS